MAANRSPKRAGCFHLAAVVAIGRTASLVQLKGSVSVSTHFVVTLQELTVLTTTGRRGCICHAD